MVYMVYMYICTSSIDQELGGYAHKDHLVPHKQLQLSTQEAVITNDICRIHHVYVQLAALCQ